MDPAPNPLPDEKAPAAPAAAARSPAVYTFADMRIKVGDRAQLEPPSQMAAGRIPVRIVGWVEGHSLIVTGPHTRSGRLMLERGENVLLRVFTGSSAFAFKSTLLKPTRLPLEYMHLSFPDRVDGLEVRNSPRFRVDLPARITTAAHPDGMDAMISNISATGALVESSEPLGVPGEDLGLEFTFGLHGIPARLKLSAAIRTTKSAEDAANAPRHQHGVTFKDTAPNDLLILRAFVWHEMYAHPRNAV